MYTKHIYMVKIRRGAKGLNPTKIIHSSQNMAKPYLNIKNCYECMYEKQISHQTTPLKKNPNNFHQYRASLSINELKVEFT